MYYLEVMTNVNFFKINSSYLKVKRFPNKQKYYYSSLLFTIVPQFFPQINKVQQFSVQYHSFFHSTIVFFPLYYSFSIVNQSSKAILLIFNQKLQLFWYITIVFSNVNQSSQILKIYHVFFFFLDGISIDLRILPQFFSIVPFAFSIVPYFFIVN